MADKRSGLDFLEGVRIGQPELYWWQAQMHEQDAGIVSLLALQEYGWPIRYTPNGQPTIGWNIQNDGSGQLRLRAQSDFGTNGPQSPYHPVDRRLPSRPYVAVDPLGRLLVLPLGEDGTQDTPVRDETGTVITVPNDGVWRTLIAKHATTKLAPGTLTLTGGSTVVVGVGTKFTRYTDGTDARAVVLRIDSSDTANGNEGSYRIATIVDDENMTLAAPAPATESGVAYRVEGEFLTGTPADPDIHLRPTVAFELVSRTVTPPADGLICYDVMYNSIDDPAVQRIDRRHAQQLRQRDPGISGFQLQPALKYTTTTRAVGSTDFNGAGTDVQFMDATTCLTGASTKPGGATAVNGGVTRGGVLMGMAEDDGGGGSDLVAKVYTPYTSVTYHGQWDSDVSVATGLGAIQGLCMATVPSSSGKTHFFIYANTAGSLLAYDSDDHGATWSALATTICNPAGSRQIRKPQVVLTRLGRLIVVFEFEDVGGSGDREIRYVYSDDYGVTWENNGNAGFTIMADAGNDLYEPTIIEDDDGRLWTAWVADSGGEVRAVPGQDFNDPTPSGLSEHPAAGYIISLDYGVLTYNTRRPRLFAGPGGMLGCIYNLAVIGTAATEQAVSHIADGRIVEAYKIVEDVSTGVGSSFQADHTLVQTTGGRCVYLFVKSTLQVEGVCLSMLEARRPLHVLPGN